MKATLKNMEDESGLLLEVVVSEVLYEHGLSPSDNRDFITVACKRAVHHYFNDAHFRKGCRSKNGNHFLSSFVSMWFTAWKTSKVNRDRMLKAFS